MQYNATDNEDFDCCLIFDIACLSSSIVDVCPDIVMQLSCCSICCSRAQCFEILRAVMVTVVPWLSLIIMIGLSIRIFLDKSRCSFMFEVLSCRVESRLLTVMAVLSISTDCRLAQQATIIMIQDVMMVELIAIEMGMNNMFFMMALFYI